MRLWGSVLCFWGLFMGMFSAAAQSLAATDKSVPAGIYQITLSWSANVHDFNHDGWPDVLLVRHFQAPARLYRNDNGRFTEVNVGTFFTKDRHDCTWGDVNHDSLPDVYCTLGALLGTGVKKNELWIQRPGHTFKDQAAFFGVADPYGRGRYVTFIDVNHDPYPDLFISNEVPRHDGIPSPNRLLINQSGASFRNAPEYGLNQEAGGGGCAQAADFDNDGWEDLLVCGTSLLLYRNNRGTRFTDVAASVGVVANNWTAAVLVDLNGDGLLDIAKVGRAQFQVQLQRNGRFQAPIAVRTLQDGQDIAAGDVNRDALPDLYVVQGNDGTGANAPDLMLLNTNGTAFAETPIPQTTQGHGQHVAAIDYNRDGRTDFIVLNNQGPVQLISFP